MARPKNTENLTPVTGQVTPGTRRAVESLRITDDGIITFGAALRRVVEAGLVALNVPVSEPQEAPATEDAPADKAAPKAR